MPRRITTSAAQAGPSDYNAFGHEHEEHEEPDEGIVVIRRLKDMFRLFNYQNGVKQGIFLLYLSQKMSDNLTEKNNTRLSCIQTRNKSPPKENCKHCSYPPSPLPRHKGTPGHPQQSLLRDQSLME